MTTERYLIALGSNMRHARHGPPAKVLQAAIEMLSGKGLRFEAVSPLIASVPLGPSRRRYANAAAIVATTLDPERLLDLLQDAERAFGRRRRGGRWGARVLDLDIVLWERGPWSSRRLTVPHREFRHRAFVVTPASSVAPAWRDPDTGLSLRQLRTRLTAARPLP